MDQPTIYELIQKYQDNTITEAEKQALMDWYRSTAYRDADFPEEEAVVKEFMHSRLMAGIGVKRINYSRRNWAVAASVLLLLGAGWLFVVKRRSPPPEKNLVDKTHEIGPGANKAILTLADGSKVSLTDASKGNIAWQDGIRITKAAGGQVVYTISPSTMEGAGESADTTTRYNTITTPPGGQFQVVLPDGSLVWLNAISSLKFPVKFSALKERRVYLTGEAYFEVVHNQEAAFRVETPRQVVEVLGTHFNINAYADEEYTNTTLLQGSVRLTAGENSALLKPGQEALFQDRFKVSAVDTEYAIAWKNGLFRFDDQRLESIMKVVSRWYNVQVVFEDNAMKEEIFGFVSTRFANISALLHTLEQTGDARFKVEGSTIRISKKI